MKRFLRSMASNRIMECPFCHSKLEAGHKFCPHCCREVHAATPPASAAEGAAPGISIGDGNVIKVGQIIQHTIHQAGTHYLKAEVHYEKMVLGFLRRGILPQEAEQELEEDRVEHGLGIIEQKAIEERCLKKFPALEAKARRGGGESVLAAKSPFRADRLAMTTRVGGWTHTWYVIAADKISFGRQDKDEHGRRVNDVILRLMPPSLENKNLSQQIGRRQFICERQGDGFVVQRASAAVMLLDGVPTGLRQPTDLSNEGRIEIAEVLKLSYRLATGSAGLLRRWRQTEPADAPDNVEGVVFRRLGNAENVGYVMLCGALPLGLTGSVTPAEGEPLAGLLCCGRARHGSTGHRWLFLQEADLSVNGSASASGCAHELGTDATFATGTVQISFAAYETMDMKLPH